MQNNGSIKVELINEGSVIVEILVTVIFYSGFLLCLVVGRLITDMKDIEIH